MKTRIIFTKTSTATGNVLESQEFASKTKAIKFYNEQVQGDGLVKSEEVTKLSNGDVTKIVYKAVPHKYSMNKDYKYELEISTPVKKYALASTVKDGLLCKQGHNYEVSNGDDYESEYEASLVLFDTEAEAMQFIEQYGYWALEPVEYTGEE